MSTAASILEDHNNGTGDGALVDQWQYYGIGHTNEFWFLTQNSDGSYTITNSYSGLVLEDFSWETGNGGKVDQWTSNGGANQHWNLSRSTP